MPGENPGQQDPVCTEVFVVHSSSRPATRDFLNLTLSLPATTPNPTAHLVSPSLPPAPQTPEEFSAQNHLASLLLRRKSFHCSTLGPRCLSPHFGLLPCGLGSVTCLWGRHRGLDRWHPDPGLTLSLPEALKGGGHETTFPGAPPAALCLEGFWSRTFYPQETGNHTSGPHKSLA